MKKLFKKLKDKIAEKWNKTRYTLGRNIFAQIAMTVLSVIQLFGSLMVFAGFTMLHTDGSVILLVIFGLIVCFLPSMLMVLLKELGKSESKLSACWYIDWAKVSPQALESTLAVLSKYYRNVPRMSLTNAVEATKIKCIREINSYPWEFNEQAKKEVLSVLSPWQFRVRDYREKYWKYVILWTLCSPIAFACQMVSICAALTGTYASRTVFSTAAGIPFSMHHLPKKQRVYRFFFNAVQIDEFEQRAWLGKFDETK